MLGSTRLPVQLSFLKIILVFLGHLWFHIKYSEFFCFYKETVGIWGGGLGSVNCFGQYTANSLQSFCLQAHCISFDSYFLSFLSAMSVLQFPEYNIFHLPGSAFDHFILLDAVVKRTVFLIFFLNYSFIILLNNIISARKIYTDSISPRIQCYHEFCDLTLWFLTC